MNAKEAREQAETINNVDSQKQIQDITLLIKNSARGGKFTCNYHKNISNLVKKYFESDGFTIKYQDVGRNEYYNEISW